MPTPALQALLSLVATWLVWNLIKRLTYKDPLNKIPGPSPESWLTGSMLKILDKDSWDYVKRITDKYEKVFKFTGLFGSTFLYVYDPKALHHILVKDQYTYEEALDFAMGNEVILGMGLLATMGEHHRKQRKLLNPVFSTAQMREMTPHFYRIVENMRASIANQVSRGEKEIDMLPWMSRTALEIIGQCGFAYSFDSLEEISPEHPFHSSLKEFVRAINDSMIILGRILVLPYTLRIGPPTFWRAVVDLLPSKRLHELSKMADVTHSTATEIFEATKRSLTEGGESVSGRIGGGGKDIMSVLLKANMSAEEKDKLSESEILSQITTLTFAAMDTTSNALARILDLLTENTEVQEKLRRELTDAYEAHATFDYEILNSLPILDAVCKESLRLFPVLPFIAREVKKDNILPLSKPITSTDGKPLNEIFVPKDTRVLISLLHCNRDPDIWGPDASEWKPERWLSPLPDTVAAARVPGVYSNIMTFNGGGRACIGFKFSELEMKVVLSVLVRNFKFASSGKRVVWQMNGIVQPTVEGAELTGAGHMKLQLPIKVSPCLRGGC